MESRCAPGRSEKDGSCFVNDELVVFINAFNEYIKTDSKKDDLIRNPIDPKGSRKEMLANLNQRFSKMCHDENCMLEYFVQIMGVQSRSVGGVVKPVGPEGKTDWLSNFDIDSVMIQYENTFPEFKFIGAFPSDCSELEFCKLSKLSYDDLASNGKKYMGIIFNLDSHGQSGSHWVAVFIVIASGQIEYCDSMGKKPNGNISRFIDKHMTHYRNKTGTNPVYKWNETKYQMDNSECGVYSCNYILRRLRGQTFEEITSKYLKFNEINSCRAAYFSNFDDLGRPHPLC